MTIRVALHHKTHYKFDRLVNLSPHVIRLRPAPHARTPIHGYTLNISPKEHFINWMQDPFGNFQARIVFPEKTDHLSVEVEVLADMTVINPFDFFVDDYAEFFPFPYDKELKSELLPYLEVKENGEKLTKWLQAFNVDLNKKTEQEFSLQKESSKDDDKEPVKGIKINDFLVMVNQKLEQDINYTIRMEVGVQDCETTLDKALGSCRDSAWLMVQVFRHLGVAARFVSGYLVQLTADVKSLDGPSGPEEDFTDLHAWCEVFIPGAGWVGLDPTSGLFAGEGHIPLACTPNPSSAAPITGAMDKCEVEFDFSNEVVRFLEDPRVTKPYTDAQWHEINHLGNAVDDDLNKFDVRLTMGGEPTFVSVDDMESEQWNTAALGDDKLALSKSLLLRLRDHFAKGGLLHYGQGKWYPGEEIPRWALGCFWRTDNIPLWKNDKLLARVDQNYGYGRKEARKFLQTLCQSLFVPMNYIISAFEDAGLYLLQEQELPENIDLYETDLSSDLERKRLAKVLKQGLNHPSGFVLPIAWDNAGSHWASCQWPLRRERLIVVPGDSPLGLRLPLHSLPYATEQEIYRPEQDPFSEKKEKSVKPAPKVMLELIRTALIIEPRDGRLFIFLPPLQSFDDYVNLINAIEATAEKLSLPVILEGYEPPKDSRLKEFKVTPDPGVIEVNIHPSKTWGELVEKTTTLYEQAHQCRLGTEKFMLDGRHTGTGGGNHVTIGAETAADSPILRRPDVLQSLITYWQHHPSLSYLFSGMFIGPTSQAPRVDEGRDEILYELEVAFKQVPDGVVDQPWLVDRIFRNLLVDITGNTHRAEFCIDKLYAPGSASGRLGILEFRGFEMPPHARMSLVQMLLIRSLIARFWKEPYHHKLVRWGTELHDRFMLPHYVWADIKEVVEDLQKHGYPFQLEWLAPFEEFRFPHYGRVQIDDIEMELRWAIEPWHVLGEEVGQQGTTRYVDSSVERLQVRLSGVTDERYVLTCNQRRVPLRFTGRKGEYVAGVRYRAWQPPSALHPTIGVNVPLVFDLIDTWNGLSVGGCTYHVSHPGGRPYDVFPVNAFEAESRRINRFWNFNHTPGVIPPRIPTPPPEQSEAFRQFTVSKTEPRPMAPPPEEASHDYPHTLDLRGTH